MGDFLCIEQDLLQFMYNEYIREQGIPIVVKVLKVIVKKGVSE